MRFTHLEVTNVRAVEHLDIDFPTTGVTVIDGDNEVGKSTLIDAIEAVLNYPSSSKRADVRSLKPVDRDVAPEVSLGVQVGDYSFTIRKKWLSGPLTELTVTAPHPMNLTGKEAEAWVDEIIKNNVDAMPFDALTVQQGNGMEVFDASQYSAIGRALDRAAKDNDSELGDSDGGEGSEGLKDSENSERRESRGDRDDRDGRDGRDDSVTSIRGLIETEYAQYFTSKQRPRGIYQKVIAEKEEKESALRELTQQAARYRDELEQYRRKSDRLTENQHALPQLEKQLAAQEEEYKKVKELQDHLEKAAHLKEIAQTTLLAEKGRWEQREDLIAQHQKRTKEFVQAGQARKEADKLFAELKEKKDAAQAQLEKAQKNRDEAQEKVRAYQLWAQWAAAAEKVTRCEEALAESAEAHETLTGVEKKLADPTQAVDDEAWEKLTAAENTWKAQTQISAATAGTITIAGPDDKAGEWTLDGPLHFELGEYTIDVAPGEEAAEAKRKADQAHDVLEGLLADHGVTTMEEAREKHNAYFTLRNDRDEARRREQIALAGQSRDDLATAKEIAAEGKERLAQDYARAHADLPADLALPGPDENELSAQQRAYEEAQNAVDSATAAREKAAAVLDNSDAYIARTKAETAQSELGAIVDRLTAERNRVSDEELSAQLEEANKAWEEAVIVEKDAASKHQALNPEAVERNLGLARNAVQNTRADIAQLTPEVSRLEGVLDSAALVLEKAEQAKQDVEGVQRKYESIRRRAEAAKRLYEVVEKYFEANQREYAEPYLSALTAKAAIVFGQTVSFHTDDSAPLVISERHKDGRVIPAENLSGGAREQLGILQRLAVADLVGDEGVPVLLDDALGYADPGRIRSMNAVLSDSGNRHQVIVFTCVPERYRELASAARISL